MFKSLWRMYEASFISGANTLINILGKMPFFNKKISDNSYSGSKTSYGIVAAVLRVILEFIKKTLFVLVFMYLPMKLFSNLMTAGETGFKADNCYVYFGLVLCGLGGSIVKSEIFNNDEHSFMMIKILRVNPIDYFRMSLLKKLIVEFASFWFAFSVCGMNFIKAFYLTIVIILARFVGETFNILAFRVTGKSFNDIRGASIFVMLASLILAYFIPYIRGCVPAAYNLVFSTVWLPVILVGGSFFMYYVWNYGGYMKIATRIYTVSDFDTQEDRERFELKEKIKDRDTGFDVDILLKKNKGFEYLNKLFLQNNSRMIINGIITRILIITGVFIVAVVASCMGHGDMVYKVISYSMPVLVFIMYAMSRGRIMCREMFYVCDSKLLQSGYYCNNESLFENYLVRLKYVVGIDIIPAVYLSFAYGIAGILAGKDGSMGTVVSVCVGILLLSLFFSNYNVFMYYICMPFSVKPDNREGSIGATIYRAVNFLMYIICYLCIFIETNSLYFTLGAALIFAVSLSVTSTIAAKVAVRTFRLKD